MNCLRSSALSIILLASAGPATPGEIRDDVKNLSGTWRGVRAAWAGKVLSAEQVRQCVLSIREPEPGRLMLKPELSLAVPDMVVAHQIWSADYKLETRYITSWDGYTIDLNPAAKPATLSALKVIGIKGHGFTGIYRMDGDELTVCFNFDRLGKPLTEFKSPIDSQVLLLTLKRRK